MRRMMIIAAVCLTLIPLLTGCAARDDKGQHPGWSDDWLRIHRDMAVEHPTGFKLDEISSAMTGNGMFYATWTTGEGRTITNAQGAEATAYDAQIYLLAKGNETAEKAEVELSAWMEREKSFYETDESYAFTAAGQSFWILRLRKALPDNPYRSGIAAFAVHGTDTISIELLCTDSWTGDAESILQSFLSGFHFGD